MKILGGEDQAPFQGKEQFAENNYGFFFFFLLIPLVQIHGFKSCCEGKVSCEKNAFCLQQIYPEGTLYPGLLLSDNLLAKQMQLQQRWTFVLSKITWLVDQPLTVSVPVIPQNI